MSPRGVRRAPFDPLSPEMNNLSTGLFLSFYLHPTGNGELETNSVLCLITLGLEVTALVVPSRDG